jgi:hypothetical protein
MPWRPFSFPILSLPYIFNNWVANSGSEDEIMNNNNISITHLHLNKIRNSSAVERCGESGRAEKSTTEISFPSLPGNDFPH